jgi:hypothetical protein
VIVIANAVVI